MSRHQAAPRYFCGALPDSPDDRDLRKRYREVPCKGQCSCADKCSLVDLRQCPCKVSPPLSESTPSVTPQHAQSIRTRVPEVYNQRDLGSCTANAVAAAYRIDLSRQGLRDFPPSRLFLYYNSRKCEGTIQEDSGASLRCTIKALNRDGVCPEIKLLTCDGNKTLPHWEYVTAKFATEPPKKCYDEAQKNTACKYERLDQDIDQLRACLKEGFPFVFGFKVPPKFQNEGILTGNMKVPAPEGMKEEGLGMHAVVAVGYSDAQKTITVLNSWGVHWGENGYFYMPYKFIEEEDYCFDFWKIEVVSEDPDIDCKGQTQKTRSYKADKAEDSGTDCVPTFPPQRTQSKCCNIL